LEEVEADDNDIVYEFDTDDEADDIVYEFDTDNEENNN
jgi:hypothetical protein